jgi:hypothetical protein
MAKRIVETLIDDIDGSVATETVTFSVDGWNYTIDLSEKNAGALREVLASYVAAGTRVGRGAGTWRPGLAANGHRASRADNKVIREWAAADGQELSARGRIPTSVFDAYEAAMKAPVAPAAKTVRRPKAEVGTSVGAAKQAPRKKAAALEFRES